MNAFKSSITVILLICSNIISAQITVDDYLAPESNIQNYFFNREEMMFLRPVEKYSGEINAKELGILVFNCIYKL